MGILERKKREKQMRRDAIIRAAEAVFFEKGVRAATLEEVAERAEVSKGTIYLYASLNRLRRTIREVPGVPSRSAYGL